MKRLQTLFSRRAKSAGLAVVALLALPALTMATQPEAADSSVPERWTVVELFSSQSCGACPEALAYMDELAARPGVLALNWSVDFWDHMGWHDTMAQPEYGARQKAYNSRLHRAGIYTPQMIIDGRIQMVGSDRDQVEEELSSPDTGTQALPVVHTEDGVIIDLPSRAQVLKAQVLLVHYTLDQDVTVETGDNKGKTLHYRNAVTRAFPVAEWDGDSHRLVINKEDLCKEGNAVLVQTETGGEILYTALVGPAGGL